ncbi:Lrp/AsnC family transcriptional regulator [Bacteroides thetaiotaomicron]
MNVESYGLYSIGIGLKSFGSSGFIREKLYFCFIYTEFVMDASGKLDTVDLQILRTLQENARLTVKELALQVNLSSTPVFERLKRLESSGYIKKYIAVLDAEKLNQGFVVFCNVKLRKMNRDIAAEFTRIVQGIPEVTECYNISGSFDYLLKIHAPNMKYYQEFILNVLGTVESLGSLESIFVMDEVKHDYGIHF